MIVDTMTTLELQRHFRPVEIELESYTKSVLYRLFNKLKQGYTIFTKQKVINNITYYVLITVEKKGKILTRYCYTIYCILRNSNGLDYVLAYYTVDSSFFKYSIHLFKRYQERFLKNESLSILEVIKIYFERNSNKYYLTKIPTGYAATARDGILLSNDKKEKDIYKNPIPLQLRSFNTFITREMLKEKQQDLNLSEDLFKEISDAAPIPPLISKMDMPF